MKELKRSVKVAEGCCSVIVVLCIAQPQFDSALCLFEVLHLFRFTACVIERNWREKVWSSKASSRPGRGY